MISDGLKTEILAFRSDRDWVQFHTLRTLSTSLALEAAELLELTQWTPDSELSLVADSKRQQIREEIADIAILMTYLTHDLAIDLESAVAEKLLLNEKKYPKDIARGSSAKYTEFARK